MIFANTRPIPAGRTALTLCAFLVTSGVLALPAHAGYWVFDGYEVKRNSKYDSQSWRSSSQGGLYINSSQYGAKTEFVSAYNSGGPATVYSSGTSSINNELGTTPPFPELYNRNVLTVTPRFHWEANNTNDKPPARLWYWVKTSINANFNHTLKNGSSPYTATNPYTPEKHFKLLEFQDGLNTVPPPLTATPPSEPSRYGGASTSMTGERMEVIDTYGQKVVRGTTRSLICALRSTAESQASKTYEEMYATSNSSFVVRNLSFRLVGRTKLQYPDTDLTSGFDYNGSPISVAAGGLDDGIHKGDIAMQVIRSDHFPDWNFAVPGLRGKLLPRVGIGGKEGVQRHNWTLKRARNGITDQYGRILMATMYSRDLVNGFQSETGAYLKQSPSTGAIAVYQSWANVEFKMGENGEKPWGSDLVAGVNGSTEWLWAKVIGLNNTPLANHNMKAIVNRLEVLIATPEGIKTKIYTRSEAEALQYNTDRDENTEGIYGEELDEAVKDYITPPPAAMTDAQGIFKGQFTVKRGGSFTVTSVGFALQDQDVYVTQPQP